MSEGLEVILKRALKVLNQTQHYDHYLQYLNSEWYYTVEDLRLAQYDENIWFNLDLPGRLKIELSSLLDESVEYSNHDILRCSEQIDDIDNFINPWVKCYSYEHQCYYFYNTISLESSWDSPDENATYQLYEYSESDCQWIALEYDPYNNDVQMDYQNEVEMENYNSDMPSERLTIVTSPIKTHHKQQFSNPRVRSSPLSSSLFSYGSQISSPGSIDADYDTFVVKKSVNSHGSNHKSNHYFHKDSKISAQLSRLNSATIGSTMILAPPTEQRQQPHSLNYNTNGNSTLRPRGLHSEDQENIKKFGAASRNSPNPNITENSRSFMVDNSNKVDCEHDDNSGDGFVNYGNKTVEGFALNRNQYHISSNRVSTNHHYNNSMMSNNDHPDSSSGINGQLVSSHSNSFTSIHESVESTITQQDNRSSSIPISSTSSNSSSIGCHSPYSPATLAYLLDDGDSNNNNTKRRSVSIDGADYLYEDLYQEKNLSDKSDRRNNKKKEEEEEEGKNDNKEDKHTEGRNNNSSRSLDRKEEEEEEKERREGREMMMALTTAPLEAATAIGHADILVTPSAPPANNITTQLAAAAASNSDNYYDNNYDRNTAINSNNDDTDNELLYYNNHYYHPLMTKQTRKEGEDNNQFDNIIANDEEEEEEKKNADMYYSNNNNDINTDYNDYSTLSMRSNAVAVSENELLAMAFASLQNTPSSTTKKHEGSDLPSSSYEASGNDDDDDYQQQPQQQHPYDYTVKHIKKEDNEVGTIGATEDKKKKKMDVKMKTKKNAVPGLTKISKLFHQLPFFKSNKKKSGDAVENKDGDNKHRFQNSSDADIQNNESSNNSNNNNSSIVTASFALEYCRGDSADSMYYDYEEEGSDEEREYVSDDEYYDNNKKLSKDNSFYHSNSNNNNFNTISTAVRIRNGVSESNSAGATTRKQTIEDGHFSKNSSRHNDSVNVPVSSSSSSVIKGKGDRIKPGFSTTSSHQQQLSNPSSVYWDETLTAAKQADNSIHKHNVHRLIDIGFTEAQAVMALKLCDDDVIQAATMLMEDSKT